MRDVIAELKQHLLPGVPRSEVEEWCDSLADEERQIVVGYIEKTTKEIVDGFEQMKQLVLDAGRKIIARFSSGSHGQV